jgi:hypothetical protein
MVYRIINKQRNRNLQTLLIIIATQQRGEVNHMKIIISLNILKVSLMGKMKVMILGKKILMVFMLNFCDIYSQDIKYKLCINKIAQ